MEDTEFDLKDPLGLACFCVETLYKKNASDIQLIHVEDQTIIADYYVLCCGRSTTHVNALSDEVEYQTAQKGVSMARVDGRGTGTWVLMDYGPVLVHIFTREQRDFYKLEKLYHEENQVDIKRFLTGDIRPEGSEDSGNEA